MEVHSATSPFGNDEECAKFTIDDITDPFVLHGIMTVGQNYVFSCWLKSEAAGTLSVGLTDLDSTPEWTKVVVKMEAEAVDLPILFSTAGTYYLYHSQLEIGTVATDWTPAPEDVDADISNAQSTANEANTNASDAASRVAAAESLIQQLADCISMLVTDENGSSLMTQTENGWTFCMGGLQEAIESMMESLNTLNEEYGSTEATIDALQQTVEDLAETAEYVRIRVFDDEPCIELGESDSDFRLLITNTRIMFTDGSNVPTYISNKGLVTENIEVENELRQGEWVWKRRSNGNLGLMWKEVTE